MLGIFKTATDRFILAVNDWLEATVPDEILPAELLGCGHYGCVYATAGRQDTVLKVTTDPTEVHFVTAAMALGEFPEGIVRYSRILQAPEQVFRNRPVYFIWREAATNVGAVLNIPQFGKMTGRDREKKQALHRLLQFKTAAGQLRDRLKRAASATATWRDSKRFEQWAFEYVAEHDFFMERAYIGSLGIGLEHIKGAQRIAVLHRTCEVIAEIMANEPVLDQVGSALSFYLDAGLLLADVHQQNIGEVTRDGYSLPVITDPGHAVDLRLLA